MLKKKGNFLYIRLKQTMFDKRHGYLRSIKDIFRWARLKKKNSIMWKDLSRLKSNEGIFIKKKFSSDEGVIFDHDLLRRYKGGFGLFKIK